MINVFKFSKGVIMSIVFGVVKAFIMLCAFILAAAIGTCFGACCGFFMGPIKIIEWTSNDKVEKTSSDRI